MTPFSEEGIARREAEAEERQRKLREDERRYWWRMAWKIPLIGIPLLILVPIVMAAVGLWVNFVFSHASSLIR